MRFFVLWMACLATVSSDPVTTVRYSYNSSDLSYLSNGIQFPVAPSDLSSAQELVINHQNDKISEMEWISRLYDHFKWQQSLKSLNNSECQSDVATYIRALKNGTTWATKS